MNVLPIDYYLGFGEKSAVITAIERALSSKVTIVTDYRKADIIVIGPYGKRHMSPEIVNCTHCWKLFCTGENVLPDYRYYHHSLTFSRFDFCGRNFRWPCWYHSFSMGREIDATYTFDETDRLIETNQPLVDPCSKEFWKRAVAIFNNMEPLRCHLFAAFDQRNKIDGVGGPFGNGFAWGDETTYREKLSILQNYGFNLCLENSQSDGYYTEKILHARSMGCIAIVYSDPHVYNDFHKDGLVNLYDFDTVSELVDHVLSLMSNKNEFELCARSPIFSKQPDVMGVQRFISSSYSQFTEGTINNTPVQYSDFTPVYKIPSKTDEVIHLLKKLIKTSV
jgi:hypothetical protein